MQSSTAQSDTQPIGIINLKSKRTPSRRHQLHFWVGDREYQFLRYMTDVEGDTLSSLLRRMIRNHMRQSNKLPLAASGKKSASN